MLLNKGVIQLGGKLRDLLEILCEDAKLVVVEGVDVDGGVRLIRRDILHLAAINVLRAGDGGAQGVAASAVVADHAAGDTDLLGTDDVVVAGDDARPGRDVNAGRAVTDLVKDDRVEHVDALDDDDAVGMAFHRGIAAGLSAGEIVPRDLRRLTGGKLLHAPAQQRPVDAQRRFPVGQLLGTLLQREEKVIHAEQADGKAQIFQIRLEAHGGGGLAGAGRAGQRHIRLFRVGAEDGRGRGADLIVKDLLAAQDELRLAAHGAGDVFKVNNAHDLASFQVMSKNSEAFQMPETRSGAAASSWRRSRFQ